MCGGGGGGNDGVEYQRQQEADRQRRIERGKAQLERIFAPLEGYEYTATNPLLDIEQEDFVSQIWDATRGQWELAGNPMEEKRPAVALTGAATQRLRDMGLTEGQVRSLTAGFQTNSDLSAIKKRAANLYSRMEASIEDNYEKTQTGDPIWQQQREAYLDYANPQLEEQYGDARGDLAYALARQGQMSGSLAGDRWADLGKDFTLRKQDVAEQARGYENQAKSDIASQKRAMLGMLTSSADPGAAATAARSAVDSLSSRPSFSPIGPLFQNTTAGLAAGLQGFRNAKQTERVNNIVYGGDPDRGSGRVVR